MNTSFENDESIPTLTINININTFKSKLMREYDNDSDIL